MSTTPTTTGKNGSIVVSALRARANFGKMLNRVEDERRSLIIEKRGTPRAVLMSIRDYVKMAAPEPEVLRIIPAPACQSTRAHETACEAARIVMKAHFPEENFYVVSRVD